MCVAIEEWQGITDRACQQLAFIEASRWDVIAPTVCAPEPEPPEPVDTQARAATHARGMSEIGHNLLEQGQGHMCRYCQLWKHKSKKQQWAQRLCSKPQHGTKRQQPDREAEEMEAEGSHSEGEQHITPPDLPPWILAAAAARQKEADKAESEEDR